MIARHVIVCFVKNASALFFSQVSRIDDHVVHCVTVVIIGVEWGRVRGRVDTTSSVPKNGDDVCLDVESLVNVLLPVAGVV